MFTDRSGLILYVAVYIEILQQVQTDSKVTADSPLLLELSHNTDGIARDFFQIVLEENNREIFLGADGDL